MDFQKLKKSVCEKIDQYLKDNKDRNFDAKNKQDGSIVTHFDLAFSKIVNDLIGEQFPEINILDEETFKDAESVVYPCFVLDPIDGTKEFATGLPQWSLSLAYLHSGKIGDPKSWGMIYNPLSGFLASSDEKLAFSLGEKHLFNQLDQRKFYTGVVSRTEYFDGLFDEIYLDNVAITPLGSIAYKLAALSRGMCDFVWTLRPKKLWDVAAGVVLLHQRGYNFYVNGEKQTQFKLRYKGSSFFGEEGLEKKIRMYTQRG